MFDKTYVKGYGKPEQHPSKVGKNYVAHRAYCDRTDETDPDRCSYAPPIPLIHGRGYERAQHDVKRVQRVKNYVGSFGRKPDKNYDTHKDYPGKGPKGCERGVPLELVSDSF